MTLEGKKLWEIAIRIGIFILNHCVGLCRVLSPAGYPSVGHGCDLCCLLRSKVHAAVGARHRAIHKQQSFVSWLSVFGVRGEAYVLGIVELSIKLLFVGDSFNPLLSVIGSLMGVGTLPLPGRSSLRHQMRFKWSFSTDPIAWNLTGEFLFKDIVLFCVCVVLFLASLPRSIMVSRSAWGSDHDQRQMTSTPDRIVS
jgi:hypothetical protein